MYKLPVFAFNEEYKSYGLASYMLSFLKENLAPSGGYAFSDFTKSILANKFNCRYENPSATDVVSHYLNFTREEDMTFFLLRFS
jgi:hypothetical protein